jgi:hypothetical protein
MSSIINMSVKQVSDRYNVIPIGRGSSEKNNKSKMESVSFQLQHKLTKEEARILIVDIVELFLKNINNSKEIADFLYNKPFTYKNLEFVVFIHDEKNMNVYHPDLGIVSLTCRGTINFITDKPNSQYEYETDVEEPYEEAYKIVTGKDYPTSLLK